MDVGGMQGAVHINLGYVYAEGGGEGLYPGAMEKAAKVFEGATRIMPSFAEAYTYWGNALQEMQRMDEAVAVFSDAIRRFLPQALPLPPQGLSTPSTSALPTPPPNPTEHLFT